ncbi:hypothetical protein, partial [Xylella fastidiosa]|uniref:hypothetical protein n=1 Tax=Xylella fastidiosa TaxID=2371 RepID=UPI00235F5E56
KLTTYPVPISIRGLAHLFWVALLLLLLGPSGTDYTTRMYQAAQVRRLLTSLLHKYAIKK